MLDWLKRLLVKEPALNSDNRRGIYNWYFERVVFGKKMGVEKEYVLVEELQRIGEYSHVRPVFSEQYSYLGDFPRILKTSEIEWEK